MIFTKKRQKDSFHLVKFFYFEVFYFYFHFKRWKKLSEQTVPVQAAHFNSLFCYLFLYFFPASSTKWSSEVLEHFAKYWRGKKCSGFSKIKAVTSASFKYWNILMFGWEGTLHFSRTVTHLIRNTQASRNTMFSSFTPHLLFLLHPTLFSSFKYFKFQMRELYIIILLKIDHSDINNTFIHIKSLSLSRKQLFKSKML